MKLQKVNDWTDLIATVADHFRPETAISGLQSTQCEVAAGCRHTNPGIRSAYLAKVRMYQHFDVCKERQHDVDVCEKAHWLTGYVTADGWFAYTVDNATAVKLVCPDHAYYTLHIGTIENFGRVSDLGEVDILPALDGIITITPKNPLA